MIYRSRKMCFLSAAPASPVFLNYLGLTGTAAAHFVVMLFPCYSLLVEEKKNTLPGLKSSTFTQMCVNAPTS